MHKNRVKKAFACLLAVGAIGVTTVSATTVDAQGGAWKYYKKDGIAHSNYLHNTKKHASSVKVGNYTVSSGTTAKKKWAKASAESSLWHVEQFYYSVE